MIGRQAGWNTGSSRWVRLQHSRPCPLAAAKTEGKRWALLINKVIHFCLLSQIISDVVVVLSLSKSTWENNCWLTKWSCRLATKSSSPFSREKHFHHRPGPDASAQHHIKTVIINLEHFNLQGRASLSPFLSLPGHERRLIATEEYTNDLKKWNCLLWRWKSTIAPERCTEKCWRSERKAKQDVSNHSTETDKNGERQKKPD